MKKLNLEYKINGIAVAEIQVIENKYASEKKWYNYRIFLCRKAKCNSKELKKMFQKEIF